MDQHGWNIWGSAPLWSLCLFPGWAKRSRRHLRCHNRQAPNITCMPGVHQSIHQSSKTNIYSTLRALILFRRRRFINHLLTYLLTYVASESDVSRCAQRPPTTNVSHDTTACHQFDHRLWKFKDWLQNNSIFTSLVPTVLNSTWQFLTVSVGSWWLIVWSFSTNLSLAIISVRYTPIDHRSTARIIISNKSTDHVAKC